ncbi:MAG: 3-dehydroquinate synthase [Candidatus Omnitrophota bacterium]|nr:3-dehydroquinate synthase [Candidatus Omnitrophota bacterium]MBU1894882.1 3-dehydroquinate synthase [Candidatus Omnitrophota bacterium]
MKSIKLNLGKRSYKILVGQGVIKELPGVIKSLKFQGPIVIITDKTVAKKTGRIMTPVLKRMPNESFYVIVPPQEGSKSIEVFQETIHKISKTTKTHRPVIVALGGGVVGDLAGFVAATYRRGVPFIQVPTTLLSQVDSAIGGKTGIDLPDAKNLVGAFYQPKIVLSDLDFLKTLPRTQIRNGLGEVIKYAIIRNKGLFEYLEKNIGKILSSDISILEKIVYECAAVKADIVEKDELDTRDLRIALNFGHTLGHAIEAASGYSNLLSHGEAVAMGMVLAGEIALRLDMLKESELNRIKSLVKQSGFSMKIKGITLKTIMNSYGYDKKFIAGSNRLVLPKSIGKIEIIEDIPLILIRTVLRKYV